MKALVAGGTIDGEPSPGGHHISASRTGSRFGFCQPLSDVLGPLLTFDSLNEYGIFWDS